MSLDSLCMGIFDIDHGRWRDLRYNVASLTLHSLELCSTLIEGIVNGSVMSYPLGSCPQFGTTHELLLLQASKCEVCLIQQASTIRGLNKGRRSEHGSLAPPNLA